MKNLFMIGIGGDAVNSNIEVHDLRFIVASSIEETYDSLRKDWYGVKDSLHIDSYKVLTEIDGYSVEIGEQSSKDLYLVHFGGIAKGEFSEFHKMSFLVADNKNEVIMNASMMINGLKNIDHIDSVRNISQQVSEGLKFIKGDYAFNDNPDWQGYIKL